MGKNSSKPDSQAGGQGTPEGLKRLEESFDRIFSGRNPFQREYLLVEEAKQWDMPLDEYRKLFESYCRYASKRWFRKFRLSTLPQWGRWTGFAEKKLWDYLQLAIGISIPVIIFIAGQKFTFETNDKQQKIASERYRQDLLSKYFDQMTELITKEQLTNSKKDSQSRIIAIARTQSALDQLDPNLKGRLIEFLDQARLITRRTNEDDCLMKLSSRTNDDAVISLKEANLTRIDLSNANLCGAQLGSTNLKDANLFRAHLNNSNLSGAHLDGAKLDGAILMDADLSEDPSHDPSPAYMSGAQLSGADLSGTHLVGAQLSGADLRSAKLVNAHLNNAFLYGADLSGADLRSANLSGAYLSDANLSGAKLDVKQVIVAKYWKQAHYDRDFSQKLGLFPEKTGEIRNSENLEYGFIVNKATGQCLGTEGNGDNDVTNILISECTQRSYNKPNPPNTPNPPNPSNSQLWRYLDDGHLLNQNGKCLGTMNGDIKKETRLILFNCIDHPDQKWKYDQNKNSFEVFDGSNKGYYMTTSSQNNVIEVVLDDSQSRENRTEQVWDFPSKNDRLKWF